MDMRHLINIVVQIQQPLLEAKHHVVYDEGLMMLDRYVSVAPSKFKQSIQHNIQKATSAFKVIDKLDVHPSWKMFFGQYMILCVACIILDLFDDTVDEKVKSKLRAVIERKKKTNKSFSEIDQHTLSGGYYPIIDKMKHYAGINYHPIANLNVDDTREEGFFNALKRLEDDFINQAENNQNKIKPMEGDKVIIKFDDGFAWVLLDRESCSIEGDAMGHCGNTGAPRAGDRVLSLRKITSDGKHLPSLTFILNNGELGEMKGRGNDKPAKHYHKYIIELLKSDYVTRITGGGYKPENNFSLMDLTKEQREDAIEHLDQPVAERQLLRVMDDVDNASNDQLLDILKRDVSGEYSQRPELRNYMPEIYSRVVIEKDPYEDEEDSPYKIHAKLYQYFYENIRGTGLKYRDMFKYLLKEGDSHNLVKFTRNIIGGEWKEAEPIILGNHAHAIEYAVHVKMSRWKELEDRLFTPNGEIFLIIGYIEEVWVDRSKLLDDLILKSGKVGVIQRYMTLHKIKDRWEEAEEFIFNNTVIKNNPKFVAEYIANAITERTDKIDDAMLSTLSHSDDLMGYAIKYMDNTNTKSWEDFKQHIIDYGDGSIAVMYAVREGKRFTEMEPKILRVFEATITYANKVIKDRWLEAEEKVFMKAGTSTILMFAQHLIAYIYRAKDTDEQLKDFVRYTKNDDIKKAYIENFGIL